MKVCVARYSILGIVGFTFRANGK